VHCECTLVSAIVSRYLRNGILIDVEIGVSKSLCAWCDAFVGMVRKRYPAISIMNTSRNRKNVAGWTTYSTPHAPEINRRHATLVEAYDKGGSRWNVGAGVRRASTYWMR